MSLRAPYARSKRELAAAFKHSVPIVAVHDLERADEHLRTWKTSIAWDVRIAAAMLHPLVSNLFVRESEARLRVCARASLPGLNDAVPEPQFECPRCGARLHSRKSARLHCIGRWSA